MRKIFLFILIISASSAQPKLPLLKNYANDFTGTLTQSQLGILDGRLRTFDDSTSNQLVVLMIPTLNDYPLDEFANETAIKNKIGTKKNDNGVLMMVVKNDRKARIEVGYGLEGALPDALASSIVRNVMIPHFKAGNYYAGISAGVNAVIYATKGEYKAIKQTSDNDREKGSGIITLLMIIFFIITFFFRGGRRGLGGFIFWGGLGGGGFPGGGGFSGGGGFGGGGFSGGGGSFGGGGASGSW